MPTARCVRDYKFHLYSYTSWQGRPFCISCGTSPVASLLAVGASKALSLVAPNGETSLSPNPIDQPYAVWMRTSLSPLDHEQKGVPAPLYSQPLSERPTVRRLDTRHFMETIRAHRRPSGHPRQMGFSHPFEPKTKLTPFGLRQRPGDFRRHPAPEPFIGVETCPQITINYQSRIYNED